jgi:hypothetical protein
MTTFQEPPLQSRRAARQTERADAPPGAFTDPNSVNQPPASTPAPSAPAEPLNYATTTRPPLPQYDGQNLRPRRTAETPGHADLPPTEALPRQDVPSYRPKDYSPEGRRSATPPNWAPSYDGTVDFQTQNRDQVAAAAAASETGYAPAAPVAEGEHTMTRRELRALREADGITAVPTGETPVVGPSPAVAAAPAVALAPAVTPYPTAAPSQAPAPESAAPAAPAYVAPAPEPVSLVEPPPLVAPTPQPSTRLDSALAEFDALAAGREPVAPAPDAPAPLPGRRAAQQPQEPAVHEPAVQEQVAQEQAVQLPQAEAAPAQQPQDALSTFESLFAAPSTTQAAPPAAPAAEAPVPSAASQLLAPPVVEAAPAPAAEPEVDPLLSAPAPQGAPAFVQPTASQPPSTPASAPAPRGPASGPTSVGHWSTQSDLDEAGQVTETTISRSVGAGSGAITTSALVLPSTPERSIAGPMSGNGEILLTGSISLPHSYSSTGAHPSRLDESDLDHLLDPGDHQVANTDSMPVRAVRAVSTHTATGSIITPAKQQSTRGFTILIVAASAMAAVVVGLLVVGLVTGHL